MVYVGMHVEMSVIGKREGDRIERARLMYEKPEGWIGIKRVVRCVGSDENSYNL